MSEIYYFILVLVILNVISGFVKARKKRQREQSGQIPAEKPSQSTNIFDVFKNEIGIELEPKEPVEENEYGLEESADEFESVAKEELVEPDSQFPDDYQAKPEETEPSASFNRVSKSGSKAWEAPAFQQGDQTQFTADQSIIDTGAAERASDIELEESLNSANIAFRESMAVPDADSNSGGYNQSYYAEVFGSDPRSAFVMGEIFRRKF
ncbi:MAG: hypothetical protein ABIA63_00775 [bacterium]